MKYDDEEYGSQGRVKDERYHHPFYIDHNVDDSRLTQSQYRVYAHLTRRAGMKDRAYPGIDSVAEICVMSKVTAIEAIRALEGLGLIRVDRKRGETNVYYITGKEEWKINPRPLVHSRERYGSNEVTPPYHSRERKIHHKDTPSKKGFSIEKQEEESDIAF